MLAVKINKDLGYARVEIDERKKISSGKDIYWMFSLIDRNTKEERIRCVLKDRIKHKLLPIVKQYVYTCDILDEDGDINMDEDECIQTRIFSDCFRSYQPNDFKNLCYILKRVNHSIWFGAGSLDTNTIESLWSQIKNITQNFSGLVVDLLKKKFNNNEIEITHSLDGWLCFALLLRDFRRLKLNINDKINLINNYLKI